MPLADAQTRYDLDAAAYTRWWAPVLRASMTRLLDRLDWPQPGVALEVGCGAGGVLDQLAARLPGALVVGVDASAGMLRRVTGQHHLVQADAQHLPLAEGAVCVAVCGFVLQHIDRPDLALTEMARVLRPGGRLALAAWVGASQPWLPDVICNEELDSAGAPRVTSVQPGRAATDSVEKLRSLADAASLTVVQVETVDLGWEPTVEEVVGQLATMRTTGRRLASLQPDQARRVRGRVRQRLAQAPPERWSAHDVCYLVAAR